MKFIDLFAGIGGFRLGMEANGHECVAFCEIDQFARASYKNIHNTEGEIEWHDITKVTNEEFRKLRGKVDVICGGFPCQAFSVAGKRLGFEDTRGTLFFEIARAAKEIQPQLLFLENVKGLLNHSAGDTMRSILSTLDELGYDCEWQVLNSKDFGVPQNRERVFIIGHSRKGSSRRVFPLRRETEEFCVESKIKILGNTKNPSKKNQGTRTMVHDPSGHVGTLTATDHKGPKQVAIPVSSPERGKKSQNGRRVKEDGAPMFTLTQQDRHGIIVAGRLDDKLQMNGRVYDPNGISPTINTMQGGGAEPKVIDFYNKAEKDICGTITQSCGKGINGIGSFGISEGFRVRKLTPRECWRLQGFPDWAFEKAAEVNSKTQLYKQAGNSVTVNVIKEIAKNF